MVVVLWSQAASESDWVKSEAGRANRDHKPVNVRTPGTSWRDVPSPYDQHHVTDLADTPGILRSIDAVWTGRTVRTAVPLHEIYYRQHGQRLIDAKQRALPIDPRDASPSELLQAGFEVVGYLDVTGFHAALLEWCKASRRGTAAQLIDGPGGVGRRGSWSVSRPGCETRGGRPAFSAGPTRPSRPRSNSDARRLNNLLTRARTRASS